VAALPLNKLSGKNTGPDILDPGQGEKLDWCGSQIGICYL